MAFKPDNASFSPKMQSLIDRWKLCREMELNEMQEEHEQRSDAANHSFSALYDFEAAVQSLAKASSQNETITSPAA